MPRAKLTAEQVLTIRARSAKGEAAAALAREFDVSGRTIREVISGDTWIHAERRARPAVTAAGTNDGKVDYAALILNVRRRTALTQAELAQRIGVTVSCLNRWKRGEARPRRSDAVLLRRLASGLRPPFSKR